MMSHTYYDVIRRSRQYGEKMMEIYVVYCFFVVDFIHLASRSKIIKHHVAEGTLESQPRVQDLQHPRRGLPRRGLQILDTRMRFPRPSRNVVIDSIILHIPWNLGSVSVDCVRKNSITHSVVLALLRFLLRIYLGTSMLHTCIFCTMYLQCVAVTQTINYESLWTFMGPLNKEVRQGAQEESVIYIFCFQKKIKILRGVSVKTECFFNVNIYTHKLFVV